MDLIGCSLYKVDFNNINANYAITAKNYSFQNTIRKRLQIFKEKLLDLNNESSEDKYTKIGTIVDTISYLVYKYNCGFSHHTPHFRLEDNGFINILVVKCKNGRLKYFEISDFVIKMPYGVKQDLLSFVDGEILDSKKLKTDFYMYKLNDISDIQEMSLYDYINGFIFKGIITMPFYNGQYIEFLDKKYYPSFVEEEKDENTYYYDLTKTYSKLKDLKYCYNVMSEYHEKYSEDVFNYIQNNILSFLKKLEQNKNEMLNAF